MKSLSKQLQSNKRIVNHLVTLNDDNTVKREFEHFTYSKNLMLLKDFKKYCISLGYAVNKIEEVSSELNNGFTYILTTTTNNTTKLKVVNEIVIKLYKKAKKLGIEYDGWESKIIQKTL
jgi:regulator of RNase E activity RraB